MSVWYICMLHTDPVRFISIFVVIPLPALPLDAFGVHWRLPHCSLRGSAPSKGSVSTWHSLPFLVSVTGTRSLLTARFLRHSHGCRQPLLDSFCLFRFPARRPFAVAFRALSRMPPDIGCPSVRPQRRTLWPASQGGFSSAACASQHYRTQ